MRFGQGSRVVSFFKISSTERCPRNVLSFVALPPVLALRFFFFFFFVGGGGGVLFWFSLVWFVRRGFDFIGFVLFFCSAKGFHLFCVLIPLSYTVTDSLKRMKENNYFQ